MVVVLDTVNGLAPRPRHPEKAHRPDSPALKKPDWIRVRAPVSRGYGATREPRPHGLAESSLRVMVLDSQDRVNARQSVCQAPPA